MTSYPWRVLRAAVLVATIAACAHGQREAAQTPAPVPASSSTVTSEDITRQPGMSLEQLLAGRIAGVRVTRAPGGGIAVQIRGPTSLSLSNAPLYVVDGVPIKPGPNGTLSWINPYDIASIEVVKDPAGTAMYGVRGANGVIIITTKRP